MNRLSIPSPAGPDERTLVADLPGRVLHLDDNLLVLDKPAGLAVHRGRPGGLTLADGLEALRLGRPFRPQILHRLDRGTSGCLAFGRHRQAVSQARRLFQAGTVEKVYWCLVAGTPEADCGVIDRPLGPAGHGHGWKQGVRADGRHAVTAYRVLARFTGFCLLEARPRTGRTHQIRAHFAHAGFPLLGDTLYGAHAQKGGFFLHALRLTLPRESGSLVVEAPLPARWRERLARGSSESSICSGPCGTGRQMLASPH